MNKYMEDRNEKGFTLIELLIAIVVVGILTAVAIVGIAGLTNKGEKSACNATLDAVSAAQAVHYANNSGDYPTGFDQMVSAGELTLSGGAQATATKISGNGKWHIDKTGGGTTVPLVITSDDGKGAACNSVTTPTT